MVSHDFIGLLVLGLFNVSIGRRQIRADLNYDAVVRLLAVDVTFALSVPTANIFLSNAELDTKKGCTMLQITSNAKHPSVVKLLLLTGRLLAESKA